MDITITGNKMLEAVFKAVFSDETFSGESSRAKLDAIYEAGQLAEGLRASDPHASLKHTVTF